MPMTICHSFKLCVVEWLPLPCAEDIRARRQRADTALRITPATLWHLLNIWRLEHFALYAFSRGVSYALANAVEHPERLEALLLGDYPPRRTAVPRDWVERAWGDSWRGKTTPQRAPRLALEVLFS